MLTIGVAAGFPKAPNVLCGLLAILNDPKGLEVAVGVLLEKLKPVFAAAGAAGLAPNSPLVAGVAVAAPVLEVPIVEDALPKEGSPVFVDVAGCPNEKPVPAEAGAGAGVVEPAPPKENAGFGAVLAAVAPPPKENPEPVLVDAPAACPNMCI